MKTRWILVWQGKRGKILARVINKGPLQEYRSFTRENYHADPEPGRVFLWESWLRHEVVPGTGKGDRISVSFNYRL